MAILLLFAFFSLALSFQYSIFELESLNHLIPNSLLFFGQHLHKTLSSAEETILKNVNDASFVFILQKLENFQMTYEGFEKPLMVDNSLIYVVPKMLYFNIEVGYVLNLGPLPITGECIFTITIDKMQYKLSFAEGHIKPSFDADLNITVSKINNNMFKARKRIESLLIHVKNYYKLLCQTAFNISVGEFYARQYGDSNHYVSFRKLGGYTVGTKSRLKDFSLGENSYGKVIIANYNREPFKNNVQEIPDIDFTRCIQFEVREIESIVNKEMAVIKNMRLTEDMIPSESYFHLDLISLSEIYTELLYEPAGTTGLLVFDCGTKVTGYYMEGKGTFGFSLPKLTIKIALNNKEQTQLLDLSLSAEGEFNPMFIQSNDNTQRIFLKLNAKSVKLTIGEVRDPWNNKHAILNRRGLEAFIGNMVNQYFMRYHKQEMLGTGILMSAGIPLGEAKYIKATGETLINVCFE